MMRPDEQTVEDVLAWFVGVGKRLRMKAYIVRTTADKTVTIRAEHVALYPDGELLLFNERPGRRSPKEAVAWFGKGQWAWVIDAAGVVTAKAQTSEDANG